MVFLTEKFQERFFIKVYLLKHVVLKVIYNMSLVLTNNYSYPHVVGVILCQETVYYSLCFMLQ